MQWCNIRRYGDAYAFDLLIARLQNSVLRKSGELADLKVELMDRLTGLQMHLNPVREKAEVINRVKSERFWDEVSVETLEEIRQPLREIMHHRERGAEIPVPPKIVNIIEDSSGVEYSRRSTSLKSVDMHAHHRILAVELTKHVETDPTLQNIREGLPVPDQEMESFVSRLLEQSSGSERAMLEEFFRTATEPLEHTIRAIIGMDSNAVIECFNEFERKHPELTEKQSQFLVLVQNHIARYGSITVDRLYEQPFTVLDADGLDGVFGVEQEIIDFLEVIQMFAPR